MTIAFTFPGQGSQAVGMGKLLSEQSVAARAVFQEVDEALGEKLSATMFDGPEDVLTMTANAQPALMAVSVALMREMESRGFSLKDKVAYVAGHSLGEYSALAAAGTFSLSDTARLLRIRGLAMQRRFLRVRAQWQRSSGWSMRTLKRCAQHPSKEKSARLPTTMAAGNW
jgi:[acyl-carrier-protein] S-malonyltransferase